MGFFPPFPQIYLFIYLFCLNFCESLTSCLVVAVSVFSRCSGRCHGMVVLWVFPPGTATYWHGLPKAKACRPCSITGQACPITTVSSESSPSYFSGVCLCITKLNFHRFSVIFQVACTWGRSEHEFTFQK